MKHKPLVWLRNIALTGISALFMSPLISTVNVFAATIPGDTPPPGSVAVYNQKGNAMYIIPPLTKDRNAPITHIRPEPQSMFPVQGANGVNKDPLYADPYIGNSANGSALGGASDFVMFNTNVTTTAAWWNAFYNGYSETHVETNASYGYWYPNESYLTDTYWTSGVDISAEVPSGSIGFTTSGGTAQWTGTSTSSTIYHSYQNLEFSGAILQVGQNESGTFKYGSSYFTVNTSDSAWVGVG
uniref:PEP-CTERM sorting domain-containing protein n=1 Tax=Sulfobacillus thermotolerans TaxID=338644 RepID=G5CJ98_9FIRM|nr:hypothetical protein [Sulfobacillus thermotolerans]AEP14376.1 hypothetical protein [Sulfobacillus thermotolerans]